MAPTSFNMALAALWCAAGIVLAVVRAAWPEWAPAGEQLMVWAVGAFVFLAVADGLWLMRRGPMELHRTMATSFSLGKSATVRIDIANPEPRTVDLEVHDHVPPTMTAEDLPRQVRVPANQGLSLTYRVKALERGLQCFPAIGYRRRSPLRLWWRLRVAQEKDEVRVYPDFKAVAHYALMARDNRLNELGIHKAQRRGEGKDFHQLRDYRVGDTLKQVDWKATSRLQRAITREYQDERDQQVMFVLDHGRRMHSRDGDLSHLDHALNAVLLLSYVALRQGDAVGFLTFGRNTRFIPPRKGPGHVNAILNAVYDLQSTNESADPVAAAEEVLARVKKRSLVILITNLGDDDHNDVSEMVRALRRRHLVLVASLRERVLADTLEQLPWNFASALAHAAIHHYLGYRQRAHTFLQRAGAMSFDVEPHRLPGHLVNRYLEIKASGTL